MFQGLMFCALARSDWRNWKRQFSVFSFCINIWKLLKALKWCMYCLGCRDSGPSNKTTIEKTFTAVLRRKVYGSMKSTCTSFFAAKVSCKLEVV